MKYLIIKIFLIPVLAAFWACSDDSGSSDSPAETPATGDTTTSDSAPTEAEVTAFILTEEYKTWFGNSTVQTAQSGSPHGKVRTFLNTELKASVDASQTEHTVGSISIKELYDSAGTTITGYAYSHKIAAGTAANTWLWYEDLNLSADGANYFGVGITTCSGCHSSGTDYLRIQF